VPSPYNAVLFICAIMVSLFFFLEGTMTKYMLLRGKRNRSIGLRGKNKRKPRSRKARPSLD